MSRKAMELALDALENYTAIKHPQESEIRDKAIEALQVALKAPDWISLPTLKWDANKGEIGNKEKFNEAPPDIRINILGEWIYELEKMSQDAHTDSSIESKWVWFTKENKLTGLAKEFVENAKCLFVSNLTARLLVKRELAIEPVINKVRIEFCLYCGKDVRLLCEVSNES